MLAQAPVRQRRTPSKLVGGGSAWKLKTQWPDSFGAARISVFLLLRYVHQGTAEERVVEGFGERRGKSVRFSDEFGDCTQMVSAWRRFEEE